MNKIMKSFRIESVFADELQQLASKYGKSQAEILEMLISLGHGICFDEYRLKELTKEDLEFFFTH